ncbi:uncharacterized protein [Nicotiana sylvestris]|uniref:uncharacterized protein n=1 Tax=Nicotiana sylvestris TaxID=4096 RepID=UPI00388C745C
MRVKCKKTSYPWLLVASYDSRTKNFVVKNYNPVHKCDPTNRNKLCNSKFLAKMFNKRIKEQFNIRIFKFQELIRKKLGLYVGRTVCRRAKNIMLNEIMGDHKLEYGRIFDYRDELRRSNPGSTCVVKLSEETFEGGCRGQLLVAVCKDGNNQMLPLAWAVVEIENMHTWRWFVNLLKGDLQLGDGLENATTDLLPNSEHKMCAGYILANWSKKWRGIERRNYFWRCERSTYEWELKKNPDEMKKLENKIVDELLYYNIERWRKVYFNTFCKCDSVDNNMAECFNTWILAASTATYMKIYSYFLQPVLGMNIWPESQIPTVIPPHVKKMPGRPNKVRRKEPASSVPVSVGSSKPPKQSTGRGRGRSKGSKEKDVGTSTDVRTQYNKPRMPGISSTNFKNVRSSTEVTGDLGHQPIRYVKWKGQ